MNHYVSMLMPVPWQAVGLAVLQTIVLYWLVLLGLKVIGRRVFGEMGPHEIIILLLIAESCDIGLTPEPAGFWGAFFSVGTILLMGGLQERIPVLRQLVESKPIVLYQHGRLLPKAMKKNMVDEGDLESLARKYGQASYKMFDRIVLEDDGSLTGVLPVGEKRRADGLKKTEQP